MLPSARQGKPKLVFWSLAEVLSVTACLKQPPIVILFGPLESALLIFMPRTKWWAILIAVLACASAHGESQKKQASVHDNQALQTLNRYLEMRLQNADWKEYSKLISWPDEPSWDCNWIVKNYDVGAPVKEREKITIPVVYRRLGLYCDNFDFEPQSKTVTVNYELVERRGGWRVDGPIPDYPDLSLDVALKTLRATASDANETPERRGQAEAATRKITAALDAAGTG
jgi:hypothetical protein